jgi:hypothetical protein
LPTENENAELRHAGMDGRHQARRMRLVTSMSTWIPALHAGMTQSRALLELTGALPPGIFKEGREGHEDRITERIPARCGRSFSALRDVSLRQVWI